MLIGYINDANIITAVISSVFLIDTWTGTAMCVLMMVASRDGCTRLRLLKFYDLIVVGVEANTVRY